MVTIIEIKLLPSEAASKATIKQKLADKAGISIDQLRDWRILKRSIDARQKQVLVLLRIEISTEGEFEAEPSFLSQLKPVHDKPDVIIVGSGPAGYFAALELIELGLKPIIFDRGKDVQTRRRDLRSIQQFGEVNPHSNYCFGEGGAGTYSDGKLYTRSHKRGNIYKILRLFVEHGAQSDILIDAHPHIGSNKLPNVVANIRKTIELYGGEINFNAHVTDLIYDDGKVNGIVIDHSRDYFGEAVILATGHSARDIYYMLDRKGITIESKPFALGVRVEHAQSLIDEIQYGKSPREEHLPASSYRLACQVGNRGVFSFCMCPGGMVVPASTAPGEIVINGMSLSRRDSPFSNSGTVVSIELEDLIHFKKHGVFAGLEFQKMVEQTMYSNGDGSQNAPAQRMTDFVKGAISKDLPASSYIPGLHTAPLHQLLPKSISGKLSKGFIEFGKKMKGYYTEEANIIGTESRTSSPIRIPRNKKTLMHDDANCLFPCGEGAGYAGGIISAAMDGQNVARAVKQFLE